MVYKRENVKFFVFKNEEKKKKAMFSSIEELNFLFRIW